MEIERKFRIAELPDLTDYPFHVLEQAYLNRDPVIRIRKEDERYYMTYKGKGLLAREEYNLPLNQESYEHLLPKADGKIIRKTRYLIPYAGRTIELDIFSEPHNGLMIAEVEFESTEAAAEFVPPEWFLEDVTYDTAYHNSNLSK